MKQYEYKKKIDNKRKQNIVKLNLQIFIFLFN